MLSRTLKMAFWVTYDHVGKLILANLIWDLIVLMPLFVAVTLLSSTNHGVFLIAGISLLVITALVTLPVTLAGIAFFVKQLIDSRDGELRRVFSGMRRYGLRAVLLWLVFIFGAACLGTSTWFYATRLDDSIPWLGLALSALAMWCLVLLMLMCTQAVPALVEKNGTVRDTVRLSALLVLDNPLFVVGLTLQLAAWSIFSLVATPLILCLFASVLVVFMMCGYEQLARKYALIQMRRDEIQSAESGTPLAGVSGGVRVITRNGRLMIDESQDDYLNRGFRDFMFPWKE